MGSRIDLCDSEMLSANEFYPRRTSWMQRLGRSNSISLFHMKSLGITLGALETYLGRKCCTLCYCALHREFVEAYHIREHTRFLITRRSIFSPPAWSSRVPPGTMPSLLRTRKYGRAMSFSRCCPPSLSRKG